MQLTLLDHLRLTFGQVVYRHKAHSQIAHSYARRSRWLRAAEASLMVGVALATCGAAFGGGRAYAVVGAVLAGFALLALLVDLAFDLDPSAQAHATCATRLWLIRERYRALLSDLADGAIDVEAARRGRDVLMSELHAIYESAPPVDPEAYQSAARTVAALDEAALSDDEIDLFLPKSLQKAGKSAA